MGIGLRPFALAVALAAACHVQAAQELGVRLQTSLVNEPDTDSAVGFGLAYLKTVTPFLDIEAAFGRHKHVLRYSGQSSDLPLVQGQSVGAVTLVPLTLTARFATPWQRDMRFWSGFGIGFYFNTLSLPFLDSEYRYLNSVVTSACVANGLDCRYEYSYRMESNMGVHGAAGVDYAVNDNVVIAVESTYRAVKADIEYRATCTGSDCGAPSASEHERLDLNGIDLAIGVRFTF